jgi:hypothetical protein
MGSNLVVPEPVFRIILYTTPLYTVQKRRTISLAEPVPSEHLVSNSIVGESLPIIYIRRLARPLNKPIPYVHCADCVPVEMAVRSTILFSKTAGEKAQTVLLTLTTIK